MHKRMCLGQAWSARLGTRKRARRGAARPQLTRPARARAPQAAVKQDRLFAVQRNVKGSPGAADAPGSCAGCRRR